MAYSGTRIPESPYGVKICRAKRDPRGISIDYEIDYKMRRSHGASWTPRRGVSALQWLYCMEHLRRGEVREATE